MTPELKVRVVSYFGQPGETEIVGQRKGRDIACEAWLWDVTWQGQDGLLLARQYVNRTLVDMVGDHGTLRQGGVDPYVFENCTFYGAEVEPTGFKRDESGALGGFNGVTWRQVWFVPAILRWRQLHAPTQ